MTFSALEICAGGGGQALGLESAGFAHSAAVEIEKIACETLALNRPGWKIINEDVRGLNGYDFRGIDLFAGGVPCPPFSIASKQLGADDDRDLFPAAVRIIGECRPAAVMLENVPGLATARFASYRQGVRSNLEKLGYKVRWQLINACDFGVPQLRPRFVLVALQARFAPAFRWPDPSPVRVTVGQALKEMMASRGWEGADAWALRANAIAPTLVGGSKLHGGPDLGPTRAKLAWRDLGVDGMGLADLPPDRSFPLDRDPRLTVPMAALIQGFPESWKFAGKKTAAYRQVGNAFPPPAAEALGAALRRAFLGQPADSGNDLLPLVRVG